MAEDCLLRHGCGDLRTLRKQPPSTFLLKIENFSTLESLVEKQTSPLRFETYESPDFSSGNHTWKLILFPNGNKKDGGEGHISLYLQIQKKGDLQRDVFVDTKLCAYKYDEQKFLMVRDHGIKCFNERNPEWGFTQFLSLKYFKHDGYLQGDKCMLGAEVFVVEPLQEPRDSDAVKDPKTGIITSAARSLSSPTIAPIHKLPEVGSDGTYAWTIDNFSDLQKIGGSVTSNPFLCCGAQWKLLVFPRGHPEVSNQYFSAYVGLPKLEENLPANKEWHVDYSLVLFNKSPSKNHAMKQQVIFKEGTLPYWGWHEFLPLPKMTEGEGYINNNKVTLQVKFHSVKETFA